MSAIITLHWWLVGRKHTSQNRIEFCNMNKHDLTILTHDVDLTKQCDSTFD